MDMTLDRETRDRLREKHVEAHCVGVDCSHSDERAECDGCYEPYPCDVIQLLDAMEEPDAPVLVWGEGKDARFLGPSLEGTSDRRRTPRRTHPPAGCRRGSAGMVGKFANTNHFTDLAAILDRGMKRAGDE